MIQRIQTIYLALAAACAFGLFGLPFATSTKIAATSSLFSDGIYNINDHIALLALFCGAGALVFISIFLFNNRKQQLLMGRFAIIANIIGCIVTGIFFVQDRDNLGEMMPDDGLGVFLPILFLVFAFLAQRGISKDEKLVRSADRLR
jgi:amino acid permease